MPTVGVALMLGVGLSDGPCVTHDAGLSSPQGMHTSSHGGAEEGGGDGGADDGGHGDDVAGVGVPSPRERIVTDIPAVCQTGGAPRWQNAETG